MREPLAIVLAAGKGTRMKSELPKVLVPVGGRPMIRYVIDAVRGGGRRADGGRRRLPGRTWCGASWPTSPGVEFVEQTEQLGTGHAVMMCRERLAAHEGPVLIVAGDSPMVQADVAADAARRVRSAAAGVSVGHGQEGESDRAWAASSATSSGEFAGNRRRKGRHARAAGDHAKSTSAPTCSTRRISCRRSSN